MWADEEVSLAQWALSTASPVPTTKLFYSQGTAKKMGTGFLKGQLAWAGWLPPRGAEASGQNFPLTKGTLIKDELAYRGRRSSQVKGRCGSKGQPWQPEAQGPSTPHWLDTCSQQTVQLLPSLSIPTCQVELRISVFLAGFSHGRSTESTGLFFVS